MKVSTGSRLTCQDDQLAAMFIAKAVLALSSKNVGCDLGDILHSIRLYKV